jgi:hypothetical protein
MFSHPFGQSCGGIVDSFQFIDEGEDVSLNMDLSKDL